VDLLPNSPENLDRWFPVKMQMELKRGRRRKVEKITKSQTRQVFWSSGQEKLHPENQFGEIQSVLNSDSGGTFLRSGSAEKSRYNFSFPFFF
jgi:hypothetical protein